MTTTATKEREMSTSKRALITRDGQTEGRKADYTLYFDGVDVGRVSRAWDYGRDGLRGRQQTRSLGWLAEGKISVSQEAAERHLIKRQTTLIDPDLSAEQQAVARAYVKATS